MSIRAFDGRHNSTEPRIQSGVVNAAQTGGQVATVNVTFNPPYATPPVVVASSQQHMYFAGADNITATGCRITARRHDSATDTTTVTCSWIAVGI